MTRIKLARIGTSSLLVLLVVAGVIVGEFNYGGLTSFGAWEIWLTCPLGFLERSLAAGELLPQWSSVLLVLLSVILLGRVFCAWVCPTVFLRRVFTEDNGGLQSKRDAAPKGISWASYSPYAVLGGVLFASFLFKFPLFCFFCPIGLFFGLLFALIKPFAPNPSLTLLLFPVLLGLELWGLKYWCRSFCPLGAFLSIVGNFNRLLLPVVRKEKCLTSKGINCQACQRACPEGIDLTKKRRFFPNSCTKCLECSDRCPTKAIKWSLWA